LRCRSQNSFVTVKTSGLLLPEREKLRDGVEAAISALGCGFLKTRSNTGLADRLRTGSLDKQDYYRQLLRMVYRLLLLLVAEEKRLEDGQNLLHPSGTPAEARDRYDRLCSVGRLRQLADQQRGTSDTDLYESVKVLFERLREGHAELGIPGLGSFLFSADSTPDLDTASLSNRDLLEALRSLCFTEDGSGRGTAVRRPVDFGHLGGEELGSVYESLLELHPDIGGETAPFELRSAAGNERKTSGSYYTPSSLINCLLDSALDPVVAEVIDTPEVADAEQALLNLRVCDPAAGSGHFLIAAAERMATHLARLRTGDDEPSTQDIQRAKRDVIGRCIYGVDLNPMAVELCKVSLWMEALDPGQPLSFLDHRIQCGNSLLGTTPKLLAGGIPNDAFQAIDGDDRDCCKELKTRNRKERDDREQRQGTDYQDARLLADTWCSVFVWKKDTSDLGKLCPTERGFRDIENNPHSILPHVKDEVRRLADQYQFFHWHLAFPDVFRLPGEGAKAENVEAGWDAGFDVLLGNPPYGADQTKRERLLLNSSLVAAKSTANSAADFLVLGGLVQECSGRTGLVVPKSLTYSYSWQGIRDHLQDQLTHVLDVSKAWDDVLLEQVLVTFQGYRAEQAPSRPRVRLGQLLHGQVRWAPPSAAEAVSDLGILPSGLTSDDQRILSALAPNIEGRLSALCSTQRGTGIQRFAADQGDIPLLGGKNIADFRLRPPDRFIANELILERSVRLADPPQAVFQNIVAHITQPDDHIRLIGCVLTDELACLDTVNILTPKDEDISPWSVTAYLSSNLINWFVYVCIYNRAVRTMHFDGFFLDRIPIPGVQAVADLDDVGRTLSDNPQSQQSWDRLNAHVYDMFAVPDDLRSIVTARHKPRWR